MHWYISFLVAGNHPLAEGQMASGKAMADTVYWNGRIYPMISPRNPNAEEAIVVKDDRIIFVGDKTTRIDLQGSSVHPGFTDAHIHPLQGGWRGYTGIVELVQEHAAKE